MLELAAHRYYLKYKIDNHLDIPNTILNHTKNLLFSGQTSFDNSLYDILYPPWTPNRNIAIGHAALRVMTTGNYEFLVRQLEEEIKGLK